MHRRKLLVIGTALLSMFGAGAFAKDKAAEQSEVRAKAAQALEDFYKADSSLRDAVAKAPGYAVLRRSVCLLASAGPEERASRTTTRRTRTCS